MEHVLHEPAVTAKRKNAATKIFVCSFNLRQNKKPLPKKDFEVGFQGFSKNDESVFFENVSEKELFSMRVVFRKQHVFVVDFQKRRE